jgi:hypothetical protein
MDLHIRAYKGRHGVSAIPSIDDDSGIATAFADPNNGLDAILRYQTTVERAYFRSVEALRKMQNDRHRRENQNGFVPQDSPNAMKPARSRDRQGAGVSAPTPVNHPKPAPVILMQTETAYADDRYRTYDRKNRRA